MEKLLFLVMVATCSATPQDLSGKVFVFPKKNAIDHVKLNTTKSEFSAVTICMRFLTDLSNSYTLFSLATPSINNDLLLFKPDDDDVMRMYVRNEATTFLSLSFPPNKWHSLCATWRADNGLAQLWLNGRPTVKRFIHSEQPISGKPIVVLGQEQDSYGGGFHSKQCFLGMISNLHMWDSVLSETEIQRYMDHRSFTPGNVFNWAALDYTVTKSVQVEDEPSIM